MCNALIQTTEGIFTLPADSRQNPDGAYPISNLDQLTPATQTQIGLIPPKPGLFKMLLGYFVMLIIFLCIFVLPWLTYFYLRRKFKFEPMRIV